MLASHQGFHGLGPFTLADPEGGHRVPGRKNGTSDPHTSRDC